MSHHVRRMSARGLVACGLSAADRRVTEVTLTHRGAPGFGGSGTRARGPCSLCLFFGGLAGLRGGVDSSQALESVYANIIKQGSLPPPVYWHPAAD